MFPKVILKKGKEKSIQRRHPWIFSGAVYGVKPTFRNRIFQ